MKRTTAAIFVILLFGACGGDGDDTAGGGGTLVEYERSGGIDGITETLEVSSDGSALLDLNDSPAREIEVSEDDLDDLRSALEGADLADLEDKEFEVDCDDCFVYTVTYEGHTVKAADIPMPEQLLPVLGELNSIMDAYI